MCAPVQSQSATQRCADSEISAEFCDNQRAWFDDKGVLRETSDTITGETLDRHCCRQELLKDTNPKPRMDAWSFIRKQPGNTP